VGVSINPADGLVRRVVIDRDEMYADPIRNSISNTMPCRSLTVAHSSRCEGAAGAAVMSHGAHVQRSS
jgi:hypothetical protein